MAELKRVAIYARVSTHDQTTENQTLELRRFVTARGWDASEYVDEGISGVKGESQRPALRKLMFAARKRQFDAVIVWDFSRFARSMTQLVEALNLFRELGISFISIREGIDTTTSNGRLMFGIFASLAEFEREIIRERVFLGLKRARTAGIKLGRPKKVIDDVLVQSMKAEGHSLRTIGERFQVSKDTINRVLSQKPL